MSVSLFTVACGYIGARALPEILLDKAWTERVNDIQVQPITTQCLENSAPALCCLLAHMPWQQAAQQQPRALSNFVSRPWTPSLRPAAARPYCSPP